MKLCYIHGKKIHKAIEVKGDLVPCCDPRPGGRTLFDRGYQCVEPFEGEESEITCKKCLAKIAKFRALRKQKEVDNG